MYIANEDLVEKIQTLLSQPRLFKEAYDQVANKIALGVNGQKMYEENHPPKLNIRFKRQTYCTPCSSGYTTTYSSSVPTYSTGQVVTYSSGYRPPYRRRVAGAALVTGAAAFTGGFVGSRIGSRRRIIGR